jgi:hypothetical protein
MIFLNIGWMKRYRGLEATDQIRGGGKFVVQTGHGHEVCNFLPCSDGSVYGYVETARGKQLDREIHLENFGGVRDDTSMITDVIWTATDPDQGARRVVGWYRNATLYRHRQEFDTWPSAKHEEDRIDTYRVRADWQDATLLHPFQRSLKLGHGQGWMGQTPWWRPNHPTREIKDFLQELKRLMEGEESLRKTGPTAKRANRRTPGATNYAYIRYISEYEIQVKPRHKWLQDRFLAYAESKFEKVEHDLDSVDVRFAKSDGLIVLGEVKPFDPQTARFAVRTAMGQLLDYGQRFGQPHARLIILDCSPGEENRNLALKNGFGISFYNGATFEIEWPRLLAV